MSSRAEGRLQLLQIDRLLQFVHKADTLQIEKMVKLGVENLVNLTEPRDGTGALHVAVSANNQDLVGFLLAQGAHPDVQDKKGLTPAMLAAELGNDSVLALLAQSQADLRLQDAEGKGVLFYCIYPTKRHSRCLQVALKSQADVNNVSAQGAHVFQSMCEEACECTAMCLLLLGGGADPNATNQQTGVTALMAAAKVGSLQLARAILQDAGNANAMDHKRLTAVHYAAMGGFFEVLQVLSAYSADMGVIDLEDCSPLHYAAASGNANCCRFLVQRGCNSKLKNRDGLLPRQIAKDAGHKTAAKQLRKAEQQQRKGNKSSGADLTSDLWALTLHDWSHEHEAELRQAFGDRSNTVSAEMFVSVLEGLEAPAELDQLHEVVSAHNKGREGGVSVNDFIRGIKYVQKAFLLSSYVPKTKKGAKRAKGAKKKGKFVLPMPICTRPPDLMPRRPDGGPPRFMIQTYYNGSDVRRFDRHHPPEHPIMNDSGWYMERPEEVYVNVNHCVRSGDLQSLDLALSQGVPVDVQDQFYKTPLMVACSSGDYVVAQYLLQRGADVEVRDQFLWTPLHHAAHAGQVELMELLLEAGAAVDARTLSGATPLMRAIQSSRPSCVDLLIKAGASVQAENKNEQTCLDIAKAFADSRVIELVQDKMDSLPKPKEPAKGKGGQAQRPKPAPGQSVIKMMKRGEEASSNHSRSSTRPLSPQQQQQQQQLNMLMLTPGRYITYSNILANHQGAVADTATARKAPPPQSRKTPPPQRDPESVILQNARISTGQTNDHDITFTPKTVLGKPPTTSQLRSAVDRRRQVSSRELDFVDLMTPFSHNIQRKPLEPAKTPD